MGALERVERAARHEEYAPPVPAGVALRRSLLHGFFGRITEGNTLAEIADVLSEKAKGGDLKAAALILNTFLAYEGGPVAPVQQAVVINNDNSFMSDRRRHIVWILSAEGPMGLAQLAARTNLPYPMVKEAVSEHEWFEHSPKGWVVTQAARQAVLPPEASSPGRAKPAKKRRGKPAA